MPARSIGWDVMVEGDQPIFIEFNINNGFFACDHTVDELYQMVRRERATGRHTLC